MNGDVNFQKYIVEFIRFTVTFLMNNKTQKISNLERYISWIHNRGFNIHALRTDQGSEHSSNKIKKLLRFNRISYELSGRASHEQLHGAERRNCTLTEMEQIILFYADLQVLAGLRHKLCYEAQ